MKLENKLKLLTVASVGGIQVTMVSLVMIPAFKDNRHKLAAVAVASAGIVTAVVTLRKIHEIDKQMNLP